MKAESVKQLSIGFRKRLSEFQIKELLPYVAAGLAVALTCYIFWPGYMSYDSIFQLQQARFGRIDNSHPAMMLYLWAVVDKIYPGPGLLLILNNSIFYCSLAYIVRRFVKSPWVTAILVLLSVSFLPMLGLLGTVWKDVTMMSFLLAACAFLLRADLTGSKIALALGIAFSFLGASFRWNAFFAAIPIWMYATILITRTKTRDLTSAGAAKPLRAKDAVFQIKTGWFRRAIKSIAAKPLLLKAIVFLSISVFCIGGTTAINNYHVRDAHVFEAILFFDALGGSHFAGVNLLPSYSYDPNTGITQADIDKAYDPRHINLSFRPANPTSKLTIYSPRNAEEKAEIYRIWLDLVTHHTDAYIKHRLTFAKVLFGIDGRQVFYPTHYGIDDNQLGVHFTPNKLNDNVTSWIQSASQTLLYRTAFLYGLGIVMAVALFLLWRRLRGFFLALAAGAALYIVSNIFILPAADFRYHSWSIAVVLVFGLILIGQALCSIRRPKVHPN